MGRWGVDWLALCIMYELSNMLVGLVLDRLRMNSTNCVETEPAFSGIYMYYQKCVHLSYQ